LKLHQRGRGDSSGEIHGEQIMSTEVEIHVWNTPSHARAAAKVLAIDGGSVVYCQTDTGYVFATLFPADNPSAWAVECAVSSRAGLNPVPPASDFVARALAALPVVDSLPPGRRAHLMSPNGECAAQA